MSLREITASSSSYSHSSPPMELPNPPHAPNAAREIFLMLLASAIRRCRVSERLCRLSISLEGLHASDSSCIKFSVSDTGVGSDLEEFHDMDEHLGRVPPSAAEKWDGVLSVTTTCIRDKEVNRYRLNLLEQVGTAARLMKLPSLSKNGNKFSGTEVSVSMSVDEGVGEFSKWVAGLIRKVSILRIPIIAFQLKSEHINIYGSNYESNPMEICILQPLPCSNIERLISGLEDYVRRHGNVLEKTCQSCFSSGENLMVGSGVAGSTRKRQIVEVGIAIAEVPDSSERSCSWASSIRNEVLYFRDYLAYPVPESARQALESTDWESYGLSLGRDPLDEDGHIALKCETLPPSVKIVIAIHCYWKQVLPAQALQRTRVDKNLVKRAVKSGLDDLKRKHRGVFLTPRALKIQKYVPDLSRALAGLILSSNDRDFQNECALLLGLGPHDVGVEGKVESCIREKVTRVVEASGGKEPKEGAPCLFECMGPAEADCHDADGGPDEYPSMDF